MSTQDKNSNKIQVSNSKKSRNFYVNLAKKMLKNGKDDVELSGLGNAIFTVVTVSEILKTTGFCVVSKIETSSVPAGNDGNRLKPKIQVTVKKAAQFDQLYEQQEKENEAKRQSKQALETKA